MSGGGRGLLCGKLERSFCANEIVHWAQIGRGILMREVGRLRQAGVLTLHRQGEKLDRIPFAIHDNNGNASLVSLNGGNNAVTKHTM